LYSSNASNVVSRRERQVELLQALGVVERVDLDDPMTDETRGM
jgi:hypothetical protein